MKLHEKCNTTSRSRNQINKYRIYLDISSDLPGSGGGASGMPGATKAPGGGEEEGRRGSERIRYSHLITAGLWEINEGLRGIWDLVYGERIQREESDEEAVGAVMSSNLRRPCSSKRFQCLSIYTRC